MAAALIVAVAVAVLPVWPLAATPGVVVGIVEPDVLPSNAVAAAEPLTVDVAEPDALTAACVTPTAKPLTVAVWLPLLFWVCSKDSPLVLIVTPVRLMRLPGAAVPLGFRTVALFPVVFACSTLLLVLAVSALLPVAVMLAVAPPLTVVTAFAEVTWLLADPEVALPLATDAPVAVVVALPEALTVPICVPT